MPELTPAHRAILERLVARGYALVAFPLYPTAIGVRRDSFAALLVPAEDGTLHILGQPSYLMDGNLSVRIQRDGRSWFVWKSKSVEATPDLLAQLDRFSRELSDVLSISSQDPG